MGDSLHKANGTRTSPLAAQPLAQQVLLVNPCYAEGSDICQDTITVWNMDRAFTARSWCILERAERKSSLPVCASQTQARSAYLVKLGTRGACDKLGTRECPGVPLRAPGEGGARPATGLMRCTLKLLKLLLVWRLQVPHAVHTL